MEKRNDIEFKVVLLGESTVGKTSIFKRFIFGEFQEIDVKNRTINAYCQKKSVKVEKKNVLLNVWDTAGEEKYHALAPNYYRDANGALLVFDLTKVESFQLIEKWISEVRSIVSEDFQVVICANKYDKDSWQVKEEEIRKLSETYNADYLMISAKENKNISEAFSILATKIIQAQLTRSQSTKRRKTVKVDMNKSVISDNKSNINGKTKGGCC